MSINLEYYRTFCYVAKFGNMRRAAELMCVTAPTVTKTIRTLEKQLGCQLFSRSVKGVRLTAAGEALYTRVKSGIQLIEAGEREINMLNNLESGTVRIAAGVAAIHHFTMPIVLETFCTRYPGVHLEIKHISTAAAQAAILSGDIDFAIYNFPANYNPREFNAYHLYRSDNIAVVGRKYAFLSEKTISFNRLMEYPLVFTEAGFAIRDFYDELYRKHGCEFVPKIVTPTLDTQLRAVQLGLGYSFMPYPYVQEKIEAGEIFAINIEGEGPLERSAYLITRKDTPMSCAAQTLIGIILSATTDKSAV